MADLRNKRNARDYERNDEMKSDDVEDVSEKTEEEEEEEEEGDGIDDNAKEEAQPWTGLSRLPEKSDLIELLKEVYAAGRRQLTILLLGKSSVGKSSLVNSILGEGVARVQAFKLQADTEITTSVVRQVAIGSPEVDGLRLKLIDTCGLEDPEAGDTVNWGALSKIAEDIRGVPIDLFLYVDRLDLYRVDPLDTAIINAITQTFGRQIWRRAILVLTHGNMPQPPPGTSYDSFVDGRIRMLRGAMPRGLLPFFRGLIPAALAENSDVCPVNKENGHRVLPDGTEWLIGLMSEVVDLALARRRKYKYHPGMTTKPNQRFRWLLPFVLAAEVVFYQRMLRPMLDANQRLVEKEDDKVWSLRRKQRKAAGLHPPHRPDKVAEWRLEQMYDDD